MLERALHELPGNVIWISAIQRDVARSHRPMTPCRTLITDDGADCRSGAAKKLSRSNGQDQLLGIGLDADHPLDALQTQKEVGHLSSQVGAVSLTDVRDHDVLVDLGCVQGFVQLPEVLNGHLRLLDLCQSFDIHLLLEVEIGRHIGRTGPARQAQCVGLDAVE